MGWIEVLEWIWLGGGVGCVWGLDSVRRAVGMDEVRVRHGSGVVWDRCKIGMVGGSMG